MSKLGNASLSTLLVGLVVTAQPVRAADLLNSPLTACPSDKTTIGGVNACGKVWKLGQGQATLDQNGKLTVNVNGLVLNDASVGHSNGTPDGVDAVAVAVVCGGKNGTLAAQAQPAPLSKDGNAQIATNLAIPRTCAEPIVLLRERYEGKIGGWLATTAK